MARTTLDLDILILDELRALARREGRSMGAVANELLSAALERNPTAEVPPFRWTTHNLGAPLVDLEDKAAVEHVFDHARFGVPVEP